MSRWWASWWEAEDSPLDEYPPAVVASWETGHRERGAVECSICAVVEAPDEAGVRSLVGTATEWRFVEPVAPDWMPPTDRFPHP